MLFQKVLFIIYQFNLLNIRLTSIMNAWFVCFNYDDVMLCTDMDFYLIQIADWLLNLLKVKATVMWSVILISELQRSYYFEFLSYFVTLCDSDMWRSNIFFKLLSIITQLSLFLMLVIIVSGLVLCQAHIGHSSLWRDQSSQSTFCLVTYSLTEPDGFYMIVCALITYPTHHVCNLFLFHDGHWVTFDQMELAYSPSPLSVTSFHSASLSSLHLWFSDDDNDCMKYTYSKSILVFVLFNSFDTEDVK